MARSTRSSTLETRSARLKLPIAKKPVFVKIAPGVGLGYRRNKTAGTWVARVADGKGGNWTKAIGNADDFDDRDGNLTLDYWQAQEKARTIGHKDRGGASEKPATVAEAVDRYEADLRARQGEISNVARLRSHLTERLKDKVVVLLTARELRAWRDGLTKLAPGRKTAAHETKNPRGSLTPSSVNRISTVFKAALNLVAEQDERVANRRAWENGLAALPDAEQPRNVILPEPVIRQIVAAAYEYNKPFGLLVEVAAVTGARASQLKHMEVQDFQDERGAPRLMIPSSRKGHGGRKIMRRPVPIPVGLAMKLRAVAAGRPPIAPLLTKADGSAWTAKSHLYPFDRAARIAGQDPSVVTMYALRHSNIVRQLLANVPVRVVAANHDTSVVMIERTYSHHIADHADALVRGAMLDIPEPTEATVVPIRA